MFSVKFLYNKYTNEIIKFGVDFIELKASYAHKSRGGG